MEKTPTIPVIDILQSEILATRSAASLIRERIESLPSSWQKISLDFSGVEFASRSFVDGLMKLRSDFEKERIDITLSNLSRQFQEMVDLVKESKPLPNDYQRHSLVPEERDYEELERLLG